MLLRSGRSQGSSSSSSSSSSSASATSSSSVSSPPLFPEDLISACFSFLPLANLVQFCACCDSTAAHNHHNWVRAARDDERWRPLILAIWPSWAPLLQVGEEEEEEAGEEDMYQQQPQQLKAPFWRLYAARMRPLPIVESDTGDNGTEFGIEYDDLSRMLISIPVRNGPSYLPPPRPLPPTPLPPTELVASDVYIHFEVREEKRWWLRGQEGQTPSPVLYSALLCLGDRKGVECSLYHEDSYVDDILPRAVFGEVSEGAGGGGAAAVVGGEEDVDFYGNRALAAFLTKHMRGRTLSLVIDAAAMHVPTGRVVRLHEQSRLRYTRYSRSTSFQSPPEGEEGNEDWKPPLFFRFHYKNEKRGASAFQYRFDLSFSAAVLLPNLEVDEEEKEGLPDLVDALLEIRFYNRLAKRYMRGTETYLEGELGDAGGEDEDDSGDEDDGDDEDNEDEEDDEEDWEREGGDSEDEEGEYEEEDEEADPYAARSAEVGAQLVAFFLRFLQCQGSGWSR